MVLALEMIADHLQKISRAFDHIDGLRAGDLMTEGGADGRDTEIEDAAPDSSEALGVNRTLVEHFAVGGYNYTNFAHAIAEAKRERLSGEHG
jgi:hypothetical protein